ncbi:DNA mismatch endonuclease (patch repair protein) [Pedobacter sp. UYP24]
MISKVPRFKKDGRFHATLERSNLMSKIRHKNTKPEMYLRRAMWNRNLRFRIHVDNLPGKPDIAIKKYRLAIFVDGEFWHGYNWEKKKKSINSNREYWIPKIEKNIQNDIIINDKLRSIGYTVFRFWSLDVFKSLPRCLNQILLYIESAERFAIPES